MFSKPHREARGRLHDARGRLHTRRRILALVSATMVAVLAALPTAASLASADGALPGGAGEAQRSGLPVPQLVAPGELLSAGELQRLLSQLPLDDLSAAQLAHYLATLEGVSALAELKLGLLTPELLGAAGLEESLREAIEQLGAGAKLGELAGAEGVAQLLPNLEEALQSKLSLLGLPLGLSLHGLLEQLLGHLSAGGGLTGLESALGGLSLEQLVSSLLGTAKAEELPLQEELLAKLATLTGALFGELGSEGTLETVLGGSQLTGEFVPTSVEEVAQQLHTSSEAVSQQLGQTSEELPETATMLTAPLSNGELLGVAPAVKGLVTGLLGNLPGGGGETPGGGGSGEGSGEGKGSGEGTGTGTGEGGKGTGNGTGGSGGEGTGSGGSGQGSGGQGGPGGTGSGGTGGSTTVLVTLPSSAAQAPAAGPAKVGKVSVVSHRVHGRVATIVLRVPAAGTASIHGKGVRTASKQAAKAERLTLKVALSKALAASLRHRHHGRAVRLTVAFHPTAGAGSSTALTVRFK